MGEVNATVIAGVLVFVLGQIVSRFILDPLQEWRSLRGEIEYVLHMYANIYVAEGLATPEKGHEVSHHYRDLASKVTQRIYAIPAPVLWLLQQARVIPNWHELREIQANLRGLSNSVFSKGYEDNRTARAQRIRKSLRLRDEG